VVFVLHDIEGFSTEQTAEILELTPLAVKTRLWRGPPAVERALN
jgi:DNA-directed RNA polymerase specialized sigma24 family protein